MWFVLRGEMVKEYIRQNFKFTILHVHTNSQNAKTPVTSKLISNFASFLPVSVTESDKWQRPDVNYFTDFDHFTS